MAQVRLPKDSVNLIVIQNCFRRRSVDGALSTASFDELFLKWRETDHAYDPFPRKLKDLVFNLFYSQSVADQFV